jgi:hypothetical protein
MTNIDKVTKGDLIRVTFHRDVIGDKQTAGGVVIWEQTNRPPAFAAELAFHTGGSVEAPVYQIYATEQDAPPALTRSTESVQVHEAVHRVGHKAPGDPLTWEGVNDLHEPVDVDVKRRDTYAVAPPHGLAPSHIPARPKHYGEPPIKGLDGPDEDG